MLHREFGRAPGVVPRIEGAIPLNPERGTKGLQLRPAGDVNGDGLSDFIVGVDILLGQVDRGLHQQWQVSHEERSKATTSFVNGSGNSVLALSHIGDVNSDGIDDLGVQFSSNGGSYLIFGDAQLGAGESTLESLHHAELRGRNLHQFKGWTKGEHDLNGDGNSDLIVTVREQFASLSEVWYEVAVYAVWGGRGLMEGPIDLDAIPGERLGFRIHVPIARPSSAPNVTAGDINGDGYDDLMIGTTLPDSKVPGNEGNTEGLILFGAADMGGDGHYRWGASPANQMSYSARFIGQPSCWDPLHFSSGWDANGDGIEDLLVVDPAGGFVRNMGYLSEASLLFGNENYSNQGSGPIDALIDIPIDGKVTYAIEGVWRPVEGPGTASISARPSNGQLQLNPLSHVVQLESAANEPSIEQSP